MIRTLMGFSIMLLLTSCGSDDDSGGGGFGSDSDESPQSGPQARRSAARSTSD